MDHVSSGSRARASMRARVEARRARAQRWDSLTSDLRDHLLPDDTRDAAPLFIPRAGHRRPRRQPGPWRLRIPLPPRAAEFLVVVGVAAVIVFAILPAMLSRSPAKSAKASAITPIPAETTALPVAAAPAPQEPISILLLGSDRRPDDSSFRTDVIILLTVDAKNGQVSALSFPRDLIAKVPNYGDDRVNVLMARGGFDLVRDTFDQSYGARPQYYFMINFDGFVSLINSIGGIEVDAAEPLTDACDLPQQKGGVCEILPGKHSMDGATALWYIRSRHTSSDFDRLRRAQEVMQALFARFLQMNAITRLPELYAQYSQDVETNMGVGKLLTLLPTALQVAGDPSRIHRYAISPAEAADYWSYTGARVLLPNYDAIRELVDEASFRK